MAAPEEKDVLEAFSDLGMRLHEVAANFLGLLTDTENLDDRLVELGKQVAEVTISSTKWSELTVGQLPTIRETAQVVGQLQDTITEMLGDPTFEEFRTTLSSLSEVTESVAEKFKNLEEGIGEATDTVTSGIEEGIGGMFDKITSFFQAVPMVQFMGLDKIIAGQLEALQKGIMARVRGAVETRLMRTVVGKELFGSILSGAFNLKVLAIAGSFALIGVALMAVLKIWMDIEKTAARFREELGLTRKESLKLTDTSYDVYFNTMRLGASLEDAVETTIHLQDVYGSIIPVTGEVVQLTIEMQKALGMSLEHAADLMHYMEHIAGYSLDITKSKFANVIELAGKYGVAPSLIMGDIAGHIEEAATYDFDNLADAAVFARRLATNIGTVLDIARQVATVEDSINTAVQLRFLTGARLRPMYMFQLRAEGDLLELSNYLLSNLTKRAKWENLSVIHREKIAETLGISVKETGLLFQQYKELADKGETIDDQLKRWQNRYRHLNLNARELSNLMWEAQLRGRGALTPWEEMAATFKLVLLPIFQEWGQYIATDIIPLLLKVAGIAEKLLGWFKKIRAMEVIEKQNILTAAVTKTSRELVEAAKAGEAERVKALQTQLQLMGEERVVLQDQLSAFDEYAAKMMEKGKGAAEEMRLVFKPEKMKYVFEGGEITGEIAPGEAVEERKSWRQKFREMGAWKTPPGGWKDDFVLAPAIESLQDFVLTPDVSVKPLQDFVLTPDVSVKPLQDFVLTPDISIGDLVYPPKVTPVMEPKIETAKDIIITENRIIETHPDDVGIFAKTPEGARAGAAAAFGSAAGAITPKVEVINVDTDVKLDGLKVGKALTRLAIKVS